ncbi:MAG: formate/nitrite transporter family protein [Bacteroidaceae bacterium]|nr:formate/nitrite transporter family protein [Bacteroidaceae bacterium]
MFKKIIEVLRSSLMSGICVGIAGFGYLATRDIIGSILFAFGLLSVVNYRLRLYTGTAGFIKKGELRLLALILVGNILGCLLVALLARMSPLNLQDSAQSILEARLAVGPLKGGILAIGCGFIMTTAVTFARRGNNLPMLFGVPLFITCGFPHCVADAFYYLTVPFAFWQQHIVEILIFYVCIVLGNFVGCNFYRIVMGANASPL